MLNRWFPHPKGGVNQGMYLVTEFFEDILTVEGTLLAEDGSLLITEVDSLTTEVGATEALLTEDANILVTEDVELTIEGLLLIT